MSSTATEENDGFHPPSGWIQQLVGRLTPEEGILTLEEAQSIIQQVIKNKNPSDNPEDILRYVVKEYLLGLISEDKIFRQRFPEDITGTMPLKHILNCCLDIKSKNGRLKKKILEIRDFLNQNKIDAFLRESGVHPRNHARKSATMVRPNLAGRPC